MPFVIVVADLALRRGRILGADGLHLLGYAGTALVTTILWGALVVAASARHRLRVLAAVTFVVGLVLVSATQVAFFRRWNVYASLDAVIESDSIFRSLIASLPRDAPALGAGASIGSLLGAVAIRMARRRPLWRDAGPGPLVALPVIAWTIALAIPVSYRGRQTSTPDTLYLHAVRSLVQERFRAVLWDSPRLVRQQLRDPLPVPELRAQPAARRNVLFVVQEAQRADVSCIDPVADCPLATRRSNAVTPRRIGFSQMRAVGSSTAVAVATLWSGLRPNASRTDLLSAPLLWDYAHAAGIRTAYFTSQHLMFQNARLVVQDLPLDLTTSGTELDPNADWLVGAPDRDLTAAFVRSLDGLGEPYFAVVHYSNIHKERRIDPDDAPFQPTDLAFSDEQTPAQKNYYRNAVHASDRAVAELVEGVRRHPSGARTVIVFISDHGEGQYEHGQENDHSGSLFDEEIHVPAWIDAPDGTLTAAEREALVSSRGAWLTEYVVAPTLLDLLGLWDDPRLAPFRLKMPEAPLTRARRSSGPLPITNVSWVWEYRLPNWGVIDGPRKLFARGKDHAWRCYDVERDPKERNDLGPEGCPDLARAADDAFHMLPRDLGRLARRPDFGGGP